MATALIYGSDGDFTPRGVLSFSLFSFNYSYGSDGDSTPRGVVGFVFLQEFGSHLQSGLASGPKTLSPCRLVGVRGENLPTRDSWEQVGAPERALRSGSCFTTNTWEPATASDLGSVGECEP